MKLKTGILCIVLGAILILSSLLLYMYNNNEDKSAGESSRELLNKVVEAVKTNADDIGNTTKLEKAEMTVTVIDEHSYIGYIYIPELEDLELPVMSEWNYDFLKKAPCRYSGSTVTDDLVLLGHNYTRHFGKLSRLENDDLIYFTDMDGITHQYKVVATDILDPAAIEEMTSGEYDLSLFTCDYSGANRFTVRCDKVE